MQVYLDNAATTALDPFVLESMMPYFKDKFGNPSSIHAMGRQTRAAIEQARKKIAELLGTSPGQIHFTSGATEANNTALWGLLRANKIQHVITSKLEHHAVLHTVSFMQTQMPIQVHYVLHKSDGSVDLDHLGELLKLYSGSLVSLMHGNNEIGSLLPIETVAEMCSEYKCFFHSDTVQTIGYYPILAEQIKANALVASAHKFHGPKGVGFMYTGATTQITPFLQGGMQERNMRGGTENVAGIVGMSKALEFAYENMQTTRVRIEKLKKQLIEGLKALFNDIQFNGTCADLDKSHYKIISAGFPSVSMADMFLFGLDIKGIAVSGGSACNSGALAGSHVLEALYGATNTVPTIRFSFSKWNTPEEVDYTLSCLKQQV